MNPALKDGDVIIVPKNLLARTSTTLKFVVEPVRPIINAASLYKILN
jgi:signal peptidase I